MEGIEDTGVGSSTTNAVINTTVNADYYTHNERSIAMDSSIKNSNANIESDVSFFDMQHQPSDQMILQDNQLSSDVNNIQKPEERIDTSDGNVISASYVNVGQMLENNVSQTEPSANMEMYMQNVNGPELATAEEKQQEKDEASNKSEAYEYTSNFINNSTLQSETAPAVTKSEIVMHADENLLPNESSTLESHHDKPDEQNSTQVEHTALQDYETTEDFNNVSEQFTRHNTEESHQTLEQLAKEATASQENEIAETKVEMDATENDSLQMDVTDEAQASSSTESIVIEEVTGDVDYETIKADPVIIQPQEQLVQLAEQEGSEEQTEVIILQNMEDVIVMETEEQISEPLSQPEVIEIAELEDESNEENVQVKGEAQKSPINVKSMKIPHHVLGRNMSNPVDDRFSNGRVPPKPRLGVKIPYRNLTSQIVSKQEIENVIMERARQRNAAHDPPAGGDVFFTKKLTQRLAKKIAPPKTTQGSTKQADVAAVASTSKSTKDSIKDNSDLIAILEGNEEEWSDVPSSASSTQKNKPAPVDEEKEREKQIALKQLEQLPQRRRGRSAAVETTKPNKTVPIMQSQKTDSSQKIEPSPQKRQEQNSSLLKTADDDVDIEPRFSTTGVVKTYTRKRKPSESVTALAKVVNVEVSPKKPLKSSNDQKISIDLPPDTYVTKSSRIIKKKVIWDPDETSSPIRTFKSPKLDIIVKVDKPVSPQKVIEKKSPKIVTKSPDEKKKIDKAALLRKPKRLTEVDKLLMDEGAVNMLYDVKNTEETVNKQKKRKLSTISLDKAQKELESKTNEIKNDLQNSSTKESPKSLRKKEALVSPPKAIKKEILPGTITRKKSKDSSRSSVHSPPASPSYVFPQHPEASRIIRRHSSSSFSSDGEMTAKEDRLEKEDRVEKEGNSASKSERSFKKKGATANAAEQKSKKTRQSANKENLTADDKSKLNVEMSKSFNKLMEGDRVKSTEKSKYSDYKTLRVKEHNKLFQIILNPGKKDVLLNTEVFTELCSVLNSLKQDSSCHAVLLSSSGKSFCQGLDYKSLISDSEEVRKKRATQLAIAVRDYLKCLAAFPKFIAAGVDGNTVGVGVTMLPLFDMVLASDKATFSTPYAQLGCAAEGGVLLTLLNVSSCALTSELLYASQKIIAGDAVKCSLVSRIIWPEKFQEDVVNILMPIANQSRQGLEAIKKQLRHSVLPSIEAALNAETDILTQHWISSECQRNFAKYKLE